MKVLRKQERGSKRIKKGANSTITVYIVSQLSLDGARSFIDALLVKLLSN